jgi:uncharacterized protein YkwD
MKLHIVAIFVAVVALFVMLPQPAQASSIEQQVVQYVNEARSEGQYCGGVWYPPVKPVRTSAKLQKSSGKHSKHMANTTFHHSSIKSMLRSVKYRWRYAGENIAAGQTTAQSVVKAWINSPGHCRILMSPKAVHIGIGFYYKADARYRSYWTMQVARPR